MSFEVLQPDNIKEALSYLKDKGEKTYIIAGGTNLMVDVYHKNIVPEKLIDISKIKEMKFLEINEKQINLGPLLTHADIEKSDLGKQYEVLKKAAQMVGGPQVRNRGTIAGNIKNASPAADVALALLALDATLTLVSNNKERDILLKEFFCGVNKTLANEDEIISNIKFPILDQDYYSTFVKIGKRNALAISIVNLALVLKYDEDKFCEDARIALGAVAPTPVRAEKAEKELIGSKLDVDKIDYVSRLVTEEISPISDIRASRNYRLKVTQNIVQKSLLDLVNRGDSNGKS